MGGATFRVLLLRDSPSLPLSSPPLPQPSPGPPRPPTPVLCVHLSPGRVAGVALCSLAYPSLNSKSEGGKRGHPGRGLPMLPRLDVRGRLPVLGAAGTAVPQGLMNQGRPRPSPKIRQEELTWGQGNFPHQLRLRAGAAGSGPRPCPSLFSGRVVCIPGYTVCSFRPARPCARENRFWRVQFCLRVPGSPGESPAKESNRGQGPQTRGGAGSPPRAQQMPHLLQLGEEAMDC